MKKSHKKRANLDYSQAEVAAGARRRA